MSDVPKNKKRKYIGSNKKKIFQSRPNRFKYLEPGFRGFMITCNFREKDCVRESYTILNEYAANWTDDEVVPVVDEIVGAELDSSEAAKPFSVPLGIGDGESDTESETEDISSQLDNEIKKSIENKKTERRFQQVDTGTPNCLFIKSTIRNPVGLAMKIVRDLAETKIQKTRFLLRLLPVENVCRANVEDIKTAAGKLFDRYFLNTEPKTFSIAVNKRYNNNVDRMSIIHELADIITFKSVAHKVDLGNPQLTIIVEIIKGLCCLSVVPDYLQLKKYNLTELGARAKDAREGGAKRAEKTNPNGDDEKIDTAVPEPNADAQEEKSSP